MDYKVVVTKDAEENLDGIGISSYQFLWDIDILSYAD